MTQQNKWSLDKVSKNHSVRPPLAIIYGDPGVGKTHFITEIPDHVMIRTGDGLGGLTPNAWPMSENYVDVMQQIQILIDSDHDYKVLAIDTLTSFEGLLQEHAVNQWNKTGDKKPPKIQDISDPDFGAGYSFCNFYWKQFVKHLQKLQETKGMAIILLAHSDEKAKASPIAASHQKICVKIDKKANKLFNEVCDVIGYMAMRTSVVEEKGTFGATRNIVDTSGQRVLYVGVHPSYDAKNRYSLPAEINATWADLTKKMKESAQAGKVEARAEVDNVEMDETAAA
jgi:hypothetical protein